MGPELGREMALAQGLEQALVLEREQALAQVLALVQAPVQAPEPRRQPRSQLAVMPAELTIFSFSSIKTPSFRFWSAKDYSIAESDHPLYLNFVGYLPSTLVALFANSSH